MTNIVRSITNGVTIMVIYYIIIKIRFFLLVTSSCSLLGLLSFEVVSSFLLLFTCRISDLDINDVAEM